MRYKTTVAPRLTEADRSSVAILAFTGPTGRPVACPVTPLVDGDDLVVSCLLALIRKAASIRRDPRVALLVGGTQFRGMAQVELDENGRKFRARFQAQELRKYPPSRVLLRLPGHRHLLWWYAGRVLIRLPKPQAEPVPGDDHVTVTWLDACGWPRIAVMPSAPSDHSASVAVPVPDGPACILVHEEERDFRDLRQWRLSGDVVAGHLTVHRRTGTLAPARSGLLDQTRRLRTLARQADANRTVLADWRSEVTELASHNTR